MENKEVFDWKKELATLKEMLKVENDRHRADECQLCGICANRRNCDEVARLEEQAKKVIDLAGKDAVQAYQEGYNEAASIWFKIKELLNWSKYWPWYVFGGLILFGLILHYIFGL